MSSCWVNSLISLQLYAYPIFWVLDHFFLLFHFSYVDARQYVDHHAYSVSMEEERPCIPGCPCLPLRDRAKSDPYVFSLATNPFYLWLICTIFTEAGEEFVPKTLTQLYTWVMLVFAHRSVEHFTQIS